MKNECALSRTVFHPGETVEDMFGVYIHIPFCARRCDYCAFAIWTDRNHLQARYLRAVRTEITAARREGLPPAQTVYVGGGTPSLVDPHLLGDIIDAVPKALDAEVTVECNPDDASPELFETYASHGVTRISFGVQSLVDHVLVSLGRSHRSEHIRPALQFASAVGLSVNADLIYGAATESLDDWERTIDGILAMKPDHVSAYGLTVEPGTPLARTPDRFPDDDVQAAMYELADERFASAGLVNYEVSNWARLGAESRHNRLYWSQGDYRGFGCAAHSHAQGRRWWNLRTPDRYIANVEAGRATEASFEQLNTEQRALERLQLALRTSTGVPESAFESDDARELRDLGYIEDLESPERGDDTVGYVRLTTTGRLLANAIALRLHAV